MSIFLNMYFFCYSFMKANLTMYDLNKLHIAYKEFEKRREEKREIIEINSSNFRLLIISLLNLVKQEDNEQSIYFNDLKFIYNKFFIMASVSCDDFKNTLRQELKENHHKDDDIQRILDLFEYYTEPFNPTNEDTTSDL